MKMYKIRIAVLLVLCIFLLAGCGEEKENKGMVYYLNFKPEVADVWEEIAEVYTAETGVPVKILTGPSNSNQQTLKAEIAKREAPTIFQVSGPVELEQWKKYCVNLSSTQLYSWLTDPGMALSDESGVYGIPYVVEGYGIIYNDAIMQKYFALSGRKSSCNSMEEVNSFQKLKEVVEEMTARKTELGIEGVFGSTSFFVGEEWRWQTHLTNLPIYYEYKDKDVHDLDVIDFSYGDNMKDIFDLYLNYSCTQREQVKTKTVEDSMTEFATGKCAMIQNGNWAWTQIASAEGNIVAEEDCKFLPIYIGADGEETQGICVGTECYLAINNMVDEASQQASIDFIEWLYSSETGKKYVTEELQFITAFNTFAENETPSNPLARQVSEYINDDSRTSVSWNFTTFPGQTYKDEYADYLLKYVMNEVSWEEVKRFVVDGWQEEKNEK